MQENPMVSIIIPCIEIDDYARECVKHCRQLDYGSYEIILLPDNSLEKLEGVRVIPTSHVTPGAKRNIGISNAAGEICAFIDSDAYPRRDWLSNAIKYFDDPEVAAVGGPGLTPREDGFMQKASGHVLSSFMAGGVSSRCRAGRSFKSDDVHSCNFIARKTVLREVGGWNEKYWPGEDTLICLSMRARGERLIQASNVVVYHHRRPLFKQHLRQVSRFGLHRGFFAKRFRGNSLRMTYFVPSLTAISLFSGVLASLINPFIVNVLILAVSLYLILGLTATLLEVRDVRLFLPVWLGIMASHLVYSVSFLIGLMKRDLEK